MLGNGSVLILGDLHLSAKYQGSHVDYMDNCIKVMHQIKEVVASRDDLEAVILLGDVIGVQERIIHNRVFLNEVMTFFEFIVNATKQPVISVRGNHDLGDYTDFDFLISRGLLTNPKEVDHQIGVRYHIVNYGEEARDLDLGDKSNIILAHADFQIPGVTNWYPSRDGILLDKRKNFAGAEMVISGHIHNPSPTVYTTMIGSDEISLFYPGCPTRVAQRYDECWYVVIEPDNRGNPVFQTGKFELEPVEVTFLPEEKEDKRIHEDELAKLHKKTLQDILVDVRSPLYHQKDVIGQVKSFRNVKQDVKDLAVTYLEQAITREEK